VGQPFFLAYLPIAGHHPYDSPEGGPFSEETEVGRYRNALKYADEALGQLVDGLRQRGRFDDTLIVVYGDHGEGFGQHEGNFGHTLFLYEENVHTPLVIAGAGLLPEQVRVGSVASLVDVAPTVLDLLGVEAPAAYQGRSLLPGAPGMALFFTDYSLPLLGLRDGNWKFVHRLGSDRSKLYDLSTDPQERNDVSASHPDRVRVYRDHLRRWATSQRGRIAGKS
jgi:arylsulfatase A-like enzyme